MQEVQGEHVTINDKDTQEIHTGNKLLHVGGGNEADWKAEQTDEVREKQPGQMCEL